MEDCGGRYIDVNVEPLETLPKKYGPFDIIIEATGASGLVVGSRRMVNNGGIVCLLGLYQGDHVESVRLDRLNLDMVLNNKVMFGSSSSNIVRILGAAWNGWPRSSVNGRVSCERCSPGRCRWRM